ncbi:MAG TPA: hypothetical protein VE993_02365, partial [Stellaceae bacterium]|nr:hypothetical protein [Stellaceae bacterium]
MPFDGTGCSAPKASDTGLFPIWTKHGRRLLREARHREGTVALRARDHDIAVARLLRDARTLIEDPRHWAQRRYWTFSGRRCAVGALRAAARGLIDPGIAWSAHNLLIAVARSRGFGTVEEMNDRSSHAEVLRAFD